MQHAGYCLSAAVDKDHAEDRKIEAGHLLSAHNSPLLECWKGSDAGCHSFELALAIGV